MVNRLRIVNDVLGTERVILFGGYQSPAGFVSAMRRLFTLCRELEGDFEHALAVSVVITSEELTLRYHADGDKAAARQELESLAAAGGVI
jgi:hypothetical protein